MQKLNEFEMATFQGGASEADCAISAGLTVLGGAVGILAVAASGGTALAFAGFGIGYISKMYGTLKACSLV
ncbi:hypothetical protein [Flavihumibacter sp. CACIAM 22H1]|uniref:hypothetical protein n=1 Tax=Flavihumibacter sp. CACIAM 22H1 TaxID=1812911 RepID=UPI0007A8CBBA|nr:hypothetical protein [Flavihumibacter sp. CACIAM 22H1]KYP13123.1 MAG: hypothetical protein A1D16_20905 [Flavihumibacter sp. CACIAM 22H1]